jgi:hypothetical protein
VLQRVVVRQCVAVPPSAVVQRFVAVSNEKMNWNKLN